MSMQRLALWGLGVAAIYFVIAAPEQAASTVREIGHTVRSGAESLIQFLRGLGR